MVSWYKFNETKIPNKVDFYSELTMENITDSDYRHAKSVFKTFNNKTLGSYLTMIYMFKVMFFS